MQMEISVVDYFVRVLLPQQVSSAVQIQIFVFYDGCNVSNRTGSFLVSMIDCNDTSIGTMFDVWCGLSGVKL
jgi:hypothetical protein